MFDPLVVNLNALELYDTLFYGQNIFKFKKYFILKTDFVVNKIETNNYYNSYVYTVILYYFQELFKFKIKRSYVKMCIVVGKASSNQIIIHDKG